MKRIIKTTISLLVFIALIYIGGNFVLRKLSVKTVEALKPRLEQRGIIVEKLNYSDVRISSFNSLAINKMDLLFYLNKSIYGKESFHAEFDARSVTIRFADFNNPSIFFTIKDFSVFVEPDESDVTKPFGKLENGYLTSRIPVYLKTPEESAKEIIDEIKKLFEENKTPMNLEMRADVLLGIDQQEVKAGIYTERIDDWTYLKFDYVDILDAAKSFDLELAEKEASIIANYPSKVPAMIKITRDAKRYSKAEKSKNKYFPEDAFRHVYWSYHLTRELGPKMAKEITDAHETIPGNSKSEREMDYHNNDIGRKYSNETLTYNEIKKRVLQSNEIIRSP